jgi:hypothetical protein
MLSLTILPVYTGLFVRSTRSNRYRAYHTPPPGSENVDNVVHTLAPKGKPTHDRHH